MPSILPMLAESTGTYLTGSTLLATRHRTPVQKVLAKILAGSIEQGIAGKTTRLPVGVVLTTISPQLHETVQMARDFGRELAKMKPIDRVRAVRRLRAALESTKYLKKSPLAGDLYHALKSLPDGRIRNPRVGNLLSVEEYKTFSDDVQRKIGIPFWATGRVVAGSAYGLPMGVPFPIMSDVAYLGRHLIRKGRVDKKSLTSAKGFVEGILGGKFDVTKGRIGALYDRFAGSLPGQVITGDPLRSYILTGKAFQKEVRENPAAAAKVMDELLQIGELLRPEYTLFLRGARILKPEQHIKLMQAVRDRPEGLRLGDYWRLAKDVFREVTK